ncbi:MAG TPA: hypothetical protein VNG71_04040 [Pyrinomonadaceae bacterium]|nr:hypothetical protein [Pyrinomonadaceae bacterium]
MKSGNARTVKRADPATSDASPAEGLASRKARAIEDRDDERITALFVMPRVYQQRKAVDSLTMMICGTVMIEILEARKIFSGTVLGTRSVTLFESRITKSVTVKVTKFVFLTVALLTVSRVVHSDKKLREICGLIFKTPIIYWMIEMQTYKSGRTRSFLTGFQEGGIELKDRSAGGWRSGLQRSEK